MCFKYRFVFEWQNVTISTEGVIVNCHPDRVLLIVILTADIDRYAKLRILTILVRVTLNIVKTLS